MALVDDLIVNYNSGPWLAKVVPALHLQTFPDIRALPWRTAQLRHRSTDCQPNRGKSTFAV
jgi:hypothetical protein